LKERAGLTNDTNAVFDVVNLGAGTCCPDELIDVCIFNHASTSSRLVASTVKRNRRKPAMLKERVKHRTTYPAGRIGQEASRDLNIVAVQEHGAIGPEGRRLLYNIGKRYAERMNVSYVKSIAKQRQQHLLRVLHRDFYEKISLSQRMILKKKWYAILGGTLRTPSANNAGYGNLSRKPQYQQRRLIACQALSYAGLG
jgi:hypothetical protein